MAEHDQLFKRAFRVPEHAAGELRAVLPQELSAGLDWGSLELVQSDLVDHKLSERFTDALFSARFRGGVEGFVWLLLEHQSEPDRWMTLRMLEYLTRSWSELVRREPTRSTLPPVVCVVVHHGERGWREPRRSHELVEGIEQFPELERLVPCFEIIVDDLGAQSPATEDTMASAADQLIQEGRRRGVAEGVQLGKAKAVLAVLKTRGIVVTPEQEERIVRCQDVAELDRWLDLVATAHTSDEFFNH